MTPTASGGREGHSRTDDGRVDVDLDVPTEMGGHGGPGTNPEQLFAVGYAACFEGGEQWLNTAERGQDYAPGDLWGCVGTWFAGRWYTQPAKDYIAAVQAYVDKKIWQTDDFVNFSG